MNGINSARLVSLIEAAAPVVSIKIGIAGQSSSVVITFDPAATVPQRAAAQSIVDGFDWSAPADLVYAAQQAKVQATAGVDNGALQAGDKIERIARAVVLLILDEINILRAAVRHPIVSISRVTTVATVVTPTAHGLTAGDPLSIAGADVAGYNLTTTVASIVNPTTFTYAMANAGVTPATGSLSYTMGAVPTTLPRTTAQLVTAIKAKIAATAE